MRTLAVLFAASSLSLLPSARAASHRPSPAHAQAAHVDAIRNEVQHQQQAMQRAMKQQQAIIRQQQEAYQKQRKAEQAQHRPVPAPHPSTIHHGAAGQMIRHRAAHGYRHHTRWPGVSDPETAALVHLKKTLDGVARGSTVNPRHAGSLANALGGVVEVGTPPTPAAVRDLAGHLVDGLAHRESTGVNTEAMALSLRGVMNGAALAPAELSAAMSQHRAALRAAKFPPDDIGSIEADLANIARQERGRL
ncbi:hypothetical protein TA3x_000750 [Tundrisphaera sp. TA3]|uniref:hypothetical protein n=1 Tax=Tundrisphaera sp. TA3 TaxID=3435775 RepID=UPI003EB998AC